MRIKTGKSYRAANGSRVAIVGNTGGLFHSAADVNYTEDGRTATRSLASLDLVGEAPDLMFVSKFVAGDGTTVEFVPVSGVPGYTHRVAINGAARDWLGHGQPSVKAAKFFLEKHAATTGARA